MLGDVIMEESLRLSCWYAAVQIALRVSLPIVLHIGV